MSAVCRPRVASIVGEWVRAHWPIRIRCRSDAQFAFAASALWMLFYNFTFWRQTFHAMWQPSTDSVAFIGSLAVLVLIVQALFLLLMPTRWLMRAAASALCILGAVSAYFIHEYGVVMNTDMLRNALQTDAAEIGDLINIDLLLYVSLLGVAPAWLVWRVSLPSATRARQLRSKALAALLGLIVAGVGVFGCSTQYAVYLREHKLIRLQLSPAAPLVSAIRVISGSRANAEHGPLQDPAGLAARVGPVQSKPLMLFIVVGETARAANFQLGGYGRETNPHLAARKDLVYFNNVTACGTSTAISVPCMFSPLGRRKFAVEEVSGVENLLDSLREAGFDVEWRENNAGCKGVCSRVKTLHYATDLRANSLCAHPYCYDAAMLEDLSARLSHLDRDSVIVFHQIGSHGPAYWQRYPAEYERFKPACRSNELHTCTSQEVTNAYDNTIAYTDDVLSRQIEILQAASGLVDSLLVYVSDHGESLGESGVYLHGMPYPFAPDVQKRVPMLLWASPGYRARTQLDNHCLQSHAADAISHDNFYHTVLGAAGVRDAVYQPALDLLSACQG